MAARLSRSAQRSAPIWLTHFRKPVSRHRHINAPNIIAGCFFGAGPLETALSNTALGFIPPPEKERAVGYGNLENVLNTLDLRLRESPYIAGDSFTAADVYVGMQIAWAIQFGPLDEKRPSFQAYADRIRGRPAAIRANRLDEEAAA